MKTDWTFQLSIWWSQTASALSRVYIKEQSNRRLSSYDSNQRKSKWIYLPLRPRRVSLYKINFFTKKKNKKPKQSDFSNCIHTPYICRYLGRQGVWVRMPVENAIQKSDARICATLAHFHSLCALVPLAAFLVQQMCFFIVSVFVLWLQASGKLFGTKCKSSDKQQGEHNFSRATFLLAHMFVWVCVLVQQSILIIALKTVICLWKCAIKLCACL